MQNQTPSFWSFIRSSSFREFLMTLLHGMYGFAPFPQPKILATPIYLTICKVHTRCGRCILVLLCARSRVVAYNIAKVQNIPCFASTLKVLWYGSMEWNMEENFSMEWKWNGRKLPVWNMEKSSFIPFHTMPWLQSIGRYRKSTYNSFSGHIQRLWL